MSCSPYFNLNITTEEMEAKLLSMTDLFNLENDSAKNYDREFLLQSLSVLSGLTSIVVANPDKYDYPMLIDRINAGTIGTTEYADFLIATGTQQFTVEQINSTYIPGTSYLSVNAMQYLDNINTYYTDSFSSNIGGGFCNAVTKFQAFLSKLKSTIDFLKQLLNIRNIINKIIDTIKEKLLSIINQLISQINSCLGSIQSVVNTIKDITHFFSEDGINQLKDTVKIAVADIASKFEIPETQTDEFAKADQILEAISYLSYRLCQFTTAIEDFMMAPVNALKGAIANCSRVAGVLTNVSNQFTFDALTAGAFRISDSNIDAIKAQLGNELNSAPTSNLSATGADGSATASNYWTTPFTDDEKAMATELVSASKAQLQAGGTRAQQYLQFQSQVLNQDDPYPAAGVKQLQQSVIIVAIRISKRINKKLIINSGYRSPAYNAKQPGSAKNSYHMKGLAMDCARVAYGADFISGENFIKAASQEGAGGIGTYPTFIHIDTGPRRTWSTISGTSLGHDNARALHQQDKFRNGL